MKIGFEAMRCERGNTGEFTVNATITITVTAGEGSIDPHQRLDLDFDDGDTWTVCSRCGAGAGNREFVNRHDDHADTADDG